MGRYPTGKTWLTNQTPRVCRVVTPFKEHEDAGGTPDFLRDHKFALEVFVETISPAAKRYPFDQLPM